MLGGGDTVAFVYSIPGGGTGCACPGRSLPAENWSSSSVSSSMAADISLGGGDGGFIPGDGQPRIEAFAEPSGKESYQ